MTTDVCNEGFCREFQLLAPPPIPPKEYLPRTECREIISSCSFLSSHKGAWSNYSDPCLPPRISPAAVTEAGFTTNSITKGISRGVTQKLPQLVTRAYLESSTPSLVNVTKSPQSFFHAGIPGWLIGVIVVAVLAFIFIVTIIVICCIKKAKGERYCLQRSKMCQWISAHTKCWKWWPRQHENQQDASLPKVEREKPCIVITHITAEPQSPTSVGSLVPLTNREPEEIPSPDLDICSDSFCEEVLKEFDKSVSKNNQVNKNYDNYCEFTKASVHSRNNVDDDRNKIPIIVDNDEIFVDVVKKKGGNQYQHNNKKKENVRLSGNKLTTVQSKDLHDKLEQHLMESSDDLVLEDKRSVHSLTADSGYASRQVSKDNCTTQC